MARNTQLLQLLDRLRAEISHSQSPALGQNAREGLIAILQGRQERLYQDWEWPFLKVDRDVTLSAGSRTYGFPSDMNYERIKTVSYLPEPGGRWIEVKHGIGPEQFNVVNSLTGQRGSPVRRWQWYEDNTFEVWPIPATNGGLMRFNGIRHLRPLLADGDRADLDDTLIVLYSAARILQRQKSADAGQVLEEAKSHYLKLRGQPIGSAQTFIMSGHDPDDATSFVHNRELQIP